MGAGSTGKSGTGYISKSTSKSTAKSSTPSTFGSKSSEGKTSSGKSSTPTFGSKPSSSAISSSSKSYPSPIYNPPKTKKSSTSFGIIWLPGKRHNKKKDLVYNPHQDYNKRAPSMYNYMSGDSPDFQPYKKKEEEASLLVPEPTKAPVASVASIGAAAVASETLSDTIGSVNTEEKQELVKHERDETKEAAGDNNETYNKNDQEYLENNEKISEHSPESKWKGDKFADKVDSVYLRPPPPHKSRSTTSTNAEEEDCGIKCLYYTMQCCDCVLM